MILTLDITGPRHEPWSDRFSWRVVCPEIKYKAHGNAVELHDAEEMISRAARCIVEEALR